MASSYTPRLILPEMASGEQSGYVTFNELARILDALLQPSMTTITATDPPVSPDDGSLYIVPAGGTGAWAGHDNEVAQWYNGSWFFYAIPTGFDIHEQENNLRWTQGRTDPYLGHVSIGHGGLVTQNPGGVTPQDIPVAGVKISTYNAKHEPAVDVEVSIANSTVKFLETGFYAIMAQHQITCAPDSSNATREWEIYFYNETDGVEVTDGILGTDALARYQATSGVVGAFVASVDTTEVNKEFSLRMRSLTGSTITVLSIEQSMFEAFRMSHSNIVPTFATSD